MSEYIVDFGDDRSSAFVRLAMAEATSHGAKLREEIVRCRDCRHYEEYSGEHWCTQHDIMTLKDMSDGFCAWGERRGR